MAALALLVVSFASIALTSPQNVCRVGPSLRASEMTRTKKKAWHPAAKDLIPCGSCDKSFRLATKLQRHLLEQHASKVSLSLEEDKFSNDPQRRAYLAAKCALDTANAYVAEVREGTAMPCPRCRPDEAKGKTFKVAIDLASHIIEKHCPGLAEDDMAISLISEAAAKGEKRDVQAAAVGEARAKVVKVDREGFTDAVPPNGTKKTSVDEVVTQSKPKGSMKRPASSSSTSIDGVPAKKQKKTVTIAKEVAGPSAKKPPTTPTAAKRSSLSLSLSPKGSKIATEDADKSMSVSAGDEPVVATTPKRKMVTRGYDLDFDDLCDLKSCVDRKYYAARKVEVTSDSR